MITPSHNNGPGWAESTVKPISPWDKLVAERDMWKANHDNQVNLRRMLMDRPDLKERAELIQKLMAENAGLKETLASLLAGLDTAFGRK